MSERMIHIAICDDDPRAAGLVERLILDNLERFSEKIEVTVYYSGERFVQAMECGSVFDIIFMDIEMRGMDGIAAGHALRADDANDPAQLIYISSYEQYHLKLFDVQPSGFIKKPVLTEPFMNKLIPAVQKAIRIRQQGKQHFLPVQQKGKELLIPFRDIHYLESRIRRISLMTRDGEIQYYGTLGEEAQKLPARYFIRIHQSYIVNFYSVKEISARKIGLITGDELPVSEKNSIPVRKAYLSFRGSLA
ncbi:LytTR family DNA-binding domain-containing protein [Paenibacillus sp. P3E]|uniref:LytR/AlgR family response regulator transcription factor n=1 Tax=Paenibacillus sp. P3E TaxID=1349435 RepID=UPI0011611564|nr:LytTR family DNA-binding domain-containing protein [Paenibacillus sp. P3E]